LYSNKSSLSTGSRYRDGQILTTSPIPGTPEVTKTYLFEGLIGENTVFFMLISSSVNNSFHERV